MLDALSRNIVPPSLLPLAALLALTGCGDSPTDSGNGGGGGGGPMVSAVYPFGAGPGTFVTITGDEIVFIDFQGVPMFFADDPGDISRRLRG